MLNTIKTLVDELRKRAKERKQASADPNNKPLTVVAKISREDGDAMSKAADLIEQLNHAYTEVTTQENMPRAYVEHGGITLCLHGTSSITAYQSLLRELLKMRNRMEAARTHYWVWRKALTMTAEMAPSDCGFASDDKEFWYEELEFLENFFTTMKFEETLYGDDPMKKAIRNIAALEPALAQRTEECMELRERVAELQFALRFYADETRWGDQNQPPEPNDDYGPVDYPNRWTVERDKGLLARTWLGKRGALDDSFRS